LLRLCRIEIMYKSAVRPDKSQMTIWRMRFVRWIPKVTNSHSEYVILIAFPLQQWLNESAPILCYTYVVCLALTLSIYWHLYVMHISVNISGNFFFCVFCHSPLVLIISNMTKEQCVITHSNGVGGIIICCA
jgi:hypothetical protein